MKRPKIAKELYCPTTSQKIGRPVSFQNISLLHAIQEVAILGSGSHDRRRDELIWTVPTFDDLAREFKKIRIHFKSQCYYLPSIASWQKIQHGKYQATTVPVKFCRTSKIKRSNDRDRWFVSKLIEHAKEVAQQFEPTLTSMQRCKANMSTGITVTNKKASLSMNGTRFRFQIMA